MDIRKKSRITWSTNRKRCWNSSRRAHRKSIKTIIILIEMASIVRECPCSRRLLLPCNSMPRVPCSLRPRVFLLPMSAQHNNNSNISSNSNTNSQVRRLLFRSYLLRYNYLLLRGTISSKVRSAIQRTHHKSRRNSLRKHYKVNDKQVGWCGKKTHLKISQIHRQIYIIL